MFCALTLNVQLRSTSLKYVKSASFSVFVGELNIQCLSVPVLVFYTIYIAWKEENTQFSSVFNDYNIRRAGLTKKKNPHYILLLFIIFHLLGVKNCKKWQKGKYFLCNSMFWYPVHGIFLVPIAIDALIGIDLPHLW